MQRDAILHAGVRNSGLVLLAQRAVADDREMGIRQIPYCSDQRQVVLHRHVAADRDDAQPVGQRVVGFRGREHAQVDRVGITIDFDATEAP